MLLIRFIDLFTFSHCGNLETIRRHVTLIWPAAFQVALDVAAWYFEEIFQHFEEKRKRLKELS